MAARSRAYEWMLFSLSPRFRCCASARVLYLQHFFDCHCLSRFDDRGLIHHTEAAVADDSLGRVSHRSHLLLLGRRSAAGRRCCWRRCCPCSCPRCLLLLFVLFLQFELVELVREVGLSAERRGLLLERGRLRRGHRQRGSRSMKVGSSRTLLCLLLLLRQGHGGGGCGGELSGGRIRSRRLTDEQRTLGLRDTQTRGGERSEQEEEEEEHDGTQHDTQRCTAAQHKLRHAKTSRSHSNTHNKQHHSNRTPCRRGAAQGHACAHNFRETRLSRSHARPPQPQLFVPSRFLESPACCGAVQGVTRSSVVARPSSTAWTAKRRRKSLKIVSLCLCGASSVDGCIAGCAAAEGCAALLRSSVPPFRACS